MQPHTTYLKKIGYLFQYISHWKKTILKSTMYHNLPTSFSALGPEKGTHKLLSNGKEEGRKSYIRGCNCLNTEHCPFYLLLNALYLGDPNQSVPSKLEHFLFSSSSVGGVSKMQLKAFGKEEESSKLGKVCKFEVLHTLPDTVEVSP